MKNPPRTGKDSIKSKTILVSFRLRAEPYQQLLTKAAEPGFSPGGYARELVLLGLGRREADCETMEELLAEIQRLRSDHALATEVLLTLVGSKKDLSHEEAAAWVKRNLKS